MTREPFAHPYIPNSAPDTRRQMLKEIGVDGVEELFEAIPERLRYRERLALPEPLMAEPELRRHVEGILSNNGHCGEYLNFLGAGCWQHFVPAVCDEVIGRSEFLTAYSGSTYPDLGKYQARFEYQSQMAELLDLDVVSDPTYDWASAAGLLLRMASRITGRDEVLVADTLGNERWSVIESLCGPGTLPGNVAIQRVAHDPNTGAMDLDDLRRKVTPSTAAVYFENPSYLGCLEPQGAEISRIAHEAGALSVVGVDPISLGVLEPPPRYGADMVCGDLQPLGVHMSCGGGLAGFMAFPDEERFVSECPLILFGIAETVSGEFAFGEVMAERTSYHLRDQAKDWVGTSTGLMGICAAVYLTALGPVGMREIGETIIQRAHFAARRLGDIEGVQVHLGPAFFKEFVVGFDGTGMSIGEINQGLLERGIFGGKDLSSEFPELGQSALYCVTEIHTREDVDRLADAVREVVS